MPLHNFLQRGIANLPFFSPMNSAFNSAFNSCRFRLSRRTVGIARWWPQGNVIIKVDHAVPLASTPNLLRQACSITRAAKVQKQKEQIHTSEYTKKKKSRKSGTTNKVNETKRRHPVGNSFAIHSYWLSIPVVNSCSNDPLNKGRTAG